MEEEGEEERGREDRKIGRLEGRGGRGKRGERRRDDKGGGWEKGRRREEEGGRNEGWRKMEEEGKREEEVRRIEEEEVIPKRNSAKTERDIHIDLKMLQDLEKDSKNISLGRLVLDKRVFETFSGCPELEGGREELEKDTERRMRRKKKEEGVKKREKEGRRRRKRRRKR